MTNAERQIDRQRVRLPERVCNTGGTSAKSQSCVRAPFRAPACVVGMSHVSHGKIRRAENYGMCRPEILRATTNR